MASPSSQRPRWIGALAATALIVAIDQAVKALVRAQVPEGSVRQLVPGVDLVHTENTGVSFGAFSGLPVWGVALISSAALVLVVVILLRAAPGRAGRWAAVLIAGGAIGNLIDRAVRGAVTDFLDLPLLPPCNVADIAITFGAILMIGALLLAPSDEPGEAPSGAADEASGR